MAIVRSAEFNMDIEFEGKKKVRLATKDMCTGCSVCVAVCPVHAVFMVEDKKGFFYPDLKQEDCTNCGKCENICPANNIYKGNMGYSDVYAANNRNLETRYRSASGGMFSAFALEMLERGGSIAGVAYTKGNACEHRIAETRKEFEAFQSTKYFQSDMTRIYGEIWNQIKVKDKYVLFCGTPCQVRAVKNYVQKERIEDRLISIDLLCRGIPSPYVYKKYVELLEEEYGKKVRNVRMKEKTMGWDKIGTMVFFEDGSEKYISKEESVFLKSFIDTNLSVRDACFKCKYKTIHREGDITIADFWGLKNNHLMDNKGTSLVIVNTEKGRRLFEKAKSRLDYIPSSMWRVYRGNTFAFQEISCDSLKRERFFELLNQEKNLKEAVNEVLQNES